MHFRMAEAKLMALRNILTTLGSGACNDPRALGKCAYRV